MLLTYKGLILLREKQPTITREELHRHYGGEVRETDFYDADYYDPKLHLKHFLEDWDYDIRLQEKDQTEVDE